ncbi:VOC family protein [uncultured Kiloniella sp.]|uniref:VOC family protein n=1 Tax=uncultured Kiloniella sp. TaxID=1133091 RepID=UPI002615535A|nr:VOC family protein [uncultured Kiloniella sp.]
MGCPVVHFEIISEDADKAQAFYGDLFGWDIDADNPMNYGMVDTESDDKGINGGIGEDMADTGGHLTFYVEVPSVEETLKLAVEKGGTVVLEALDVPGGPTIGLFNDPDGRRVGLVEA